MNRLLTTIPGARGRGPVRVERKIRRAWSRGAVHAAGTAAVEDALCPLGGLMTPERLQELLGRKGVRSGNGQNGPSPAGKPSAIKAPEGDPGCAEIAAGSAQKCRYAPSDAVEKRDIRRGALAADVCRHIWAERGRSAPILYGSA